MCKPFHRGFGGWGTAPAGLSGLDRVSKWPPLRRCGEEFTSPKGRQFLLCFVRKLRSKAANVSKGPTGVPKQCALSLVQEYFSARRICVVANARFSGSEGAASHEAAGDRRIRAKIQPACAG